MTPWVMKDELDVNNPEEKKAGLPAGHPIYKTMVTVLYPCLELGKEGLPGGSRKQVRKSLWRTVM